MGKQAYVRLVEHGKQQNPLLHISAAAAGRVQPKVPCEFNRVQPELWKPSRRPVWKAFHNASSAIIAQAEDGRLWSWDDLCTRVSDPEKVVFY